MAVKLRGRQCGQVSTQEVVNLTLLHLFFVLVIVAPGIDGSTGSDTCSFIFDLVSTFLSFF